MLYPSPRSTRLRRKRIRFRSSSPSSSTLTTWCWCQHQVVAPFLSIAASHPVTGLDSSPVLDQFQPSSSPAPVHLFNAINYHHVQRLNFSHDAHVCAVYSLLISSYRKHLRCAAHRKRKHLAYLRPITSHHMVPSNPLLLFPCIPGRFSRFISLVTRECSFSHFKTNVNSQ